MDRYSFAREAIVRAGKLLYDRLLVASNDGNISARVGNNEILITPTGVSKGFMACEDIVLIDMDGNVLSGGKPSSEYNMHIAVYKNRSDVLACVHAHPPKATAFASSSQSLDSLLLPEAVLALGNVACTEYASPSTHELAKSVASCIGEADVLLLSCHGALTVGKDVMDAYFKMESLEHVASIALYTRVLGNRMPLPDGERERLLDIRRDIYGKQVIKKP